MDVEFLVRGKVLYATTPEDSVRRRSVTRIHDIRAALVRPPQFRPPRHLGLGRPPRDRFDEQAEDEAQAPKLEGEDIVELILKGTGSRHWDHEAVSIRAIGGRLVVRHTPEMQRKITRLLLSLGAF